MSEAHLSTHKHLMPFQGYSTHPQTLGVKGHGSYQDHVSWPTDDVSDS